MAEMTHITHSFDPVFDENSRVLILGTLPSVKSREQGFFYGHPQNRFWRVVASVTHSPVPVTIPEKKAVLLENGIAVWDVIAECDIAGSSDASIKNTVPADLSPIFSGADIKAVFANGTAAAKLYDRFQKKSCGMAITTLPSTSPANAAWSFEKLANRWSEMISQYLDNAKDGVIR